ncbi:MAG: DUF4326 domain-containing protein [Minwuia sp.]|nr:DUF4326 domain-containing protein [Minwuia sp.]
MTVPVRIQRRRVKGFDMQAVSLAANGRAARYVGRGTVFGNLTPCTRHGCTRRPCGCCEPFRCCLDDFTEYLNSGLEGRPSRSGQLRIALDAQQGYPRRTAMIDALPTLRGLNLACWCPLDRPCHADILLEVVNR